MRSIKGVKWKHVPRTSNEADLGIVVNGWTSLRLLTFKLLGEDCLDGVFAVHSRWKCHVDCLESPHRRRRCFRQNDEAPTQIESQRWGYHSFMLHSLGLWWEFRFVA